jgi:molybdopterin/thiamine biosynthesis adenylyltransferase
MNVLTIPRARLGQLLRDIGRQAPPIRCPVGVSRWGGHQELLVAAPGAATSRYMLLAVSDEFGAPRSLPGECAGVLTLGARQRRGSARAFAHLQPGPAPIDRLKLVGPGMHVLPLRPGTAQGSEAGIAQAVRERWSRTIAALGDDVWQRLIGLHHGIVGAGRSGSILAQALTAGWGVERLTLIDPDIIERHNLGEMAGVTEDDVGQRKVEVLARRLRSADLARPDVVPVSSSITRLPALRAVLPCDVLFGCVDHDGARLALAALAILFIKPYVDIATGIHGAGGCRRMGADVRLVVPGGPCLLCMGLADPGGARRALTSADAELAAYAGRDWRQERAGSLRSLNELAVALGLRLWEDFVAERVTADTWAHVELGPTGRVSVAYPPVTAGASCPLCPLLGQGEEGMARMRGLFQGEAGA